MDKCTGQPPELYRAGGALVRCYLHEDGAPAPAGPHSGAVDA